MFKLTFALLTAMIVTAVMAASSMAAYKTCTVAEITGTTVTLDCSKNMDTLQAGDKVKVKSAKRKAIEGC